LFRLGSTVAASLAALLLSACGRSNSPVHSGQPVPDINETVFEVSMQGEAAITPAFAGTDVHFEPPLEMGKTASADDRTSRSLDQSAVEFRQAWQHNNVVASGGTAVFTPNWEGPSAGAAGLSFCCYKFQVGQASAVDRQTLKLQWDPEQRLDDVETQCCIGVSDWVRNGWEWFAGPADGVLSMESLEPFIGPDGEVLVMVIVMGQQQAALERVTIGAPELRGGGYLPEEFREVSAEASDADLSLPRTASVNPPSLDLSVDMPPARDQGTAASSSAFAAGDACFGFELNRLYAASNWNSFSPFNAVAPRSLYVRTGIAQTPTIPPPSCPNKGRTLSQVFSFLKTGGAMIEGRDPYNTTDFCNANFNSQQLADAALLKSFSTITLQGQTSSTVNNIKKQLVDGNRLVAFGMLIDQGFLDYEAGEVYQFTGPAIGGQVLAIVGYDDALQAFKVRNSWGKGWGDNGYGFLSYDIFSAPNGAQVTALFALTAQFNQAVVDRFVPLTLAPPTGVTATDGTFTDRVRVSWNAVAGATKYKVFRATTVSFQFNFVGTTTTTQFDDPQPTLETFFYRIRSSNSTEDSLLSPGDSGNAGLAAPTGLSAFNLPNNVRVDWQPVNATGFLGYKVFRASSSNGTYVQAGGSGGTSFNDSQPTTATFFYKVKTSTTAGDSALSATFASGHALVAAPTGVTASDGTFTDHVHITWNPAAGDNGTFSYSVFAKGPGGLPFEFTEIDPGQALEADFFTPNDDSFSFTVRTDDPGNGQSVASEPDFGNVGLEAPLGLNATDGTLSDRIRITWNAVPSVTGYKLFRSTDANGTFVEIATTTALTLDVTSGFAPPQFFRIKASNANGDSAFSGVEFGFVGVSAPQNVQASDGTFPNKVQVTWDSVPFATSYKVFRATSATGTFTQVAEIAGTSIDNTTASTTPLFFKIKASRTGLGDSVFSAVDSGFRQ
jgi:hypothetical protein